MQTLHHRRKAGNTVSHVHPGPKETMLNSIIRKARAKAQGKRLYIRGVLNQDPSTEASPVECSSRRTKKKLTFAMVHSKVVLIDPFSAHPILLTGSHNIGPKASGKNDENMLIIRDAPGFGGGVRREHHGDL